MNSRLRSTGITVAVIGLIATAAACDDFMTVELPEVIDAESLDPEEDAAMFARSTQQNFAEAYGYLITYSAWFTGEALVAETFPTRNEFGQRSLSTLNGSLSSDVWAPVSLARSSGDELLNFLAEVQADGQELNEARAALFSGYSFLFMGEHFCEGAVDEGPPLTPEMMLDSAVARFTVARDRATAVAGDEAATDLANAALVGRARAHLQVGRASEAAADAEQVPDDFRFNLQYVDDAANRGRLSNRLWIWTFNRGGISVAPAFRDLDDPRVPVDEPRDDLPPFDGVTEFWPQMKYPGFGADIRLASGLEARYIAAEANGTSAMLELIEARRAANGQSEYDGPTDDASVLREFMDQRSREFFLEGKRLGDFRRHPDAVQNMPEPGSEYHKAGFDPISDQVCYPLPATETRNNPNFEG